MTKYSLKALKVLCKFSPNDYLVIREGTDGSTSEQLFWETVFRTHPRKTFLVVGCHSKSDVLDYLDQIIRTKTQNIIASCDRDYDGSNGRSQATSRLVQTRGHSFESDLIQPEIISAMMKQRGIMPLGCLAVGCDNQHCGFELGLRKMAVIDIRTQSSASALKSSEWHHVASMTPCPSVTPLKLRQVARQNSVSVPSLDSLASNFKDLNGFENIPGRIKESLWLKWFRNICRIKGNYSKQSFTKEAAEEFSASYPSSSGALRIYYDNAISHF